MFGHEAMVAPRVSPAFREQLYTVYRHLTRGDEHEIADGPNGADAPKAAARLKGEHSAILSVQCWLQRTLLRLGTLRIAPERPERAARTGVSSPLPCVA